MLLNSKQNCWQEIVLVYHLALFFPFKLFIHAGVLGVALLEYLPEKNDPLFLVIVLPKGMATVAMLPLVVVSMINSLALMVLSLVFHYSIFLLDHNLL